MYMVPRSMANMMAILTWCDCRDKVTKLKMANNTNTKAVSMGDMCPSRSPAVHVGMILSIVLVRVDVEERLAVALRASCGCTVVA